jgi:Uma2 family endonuclease
VAPDVFVVRGVGKQREGRKRRTYKLWEEGVAPCVVIEITLSETKNEDLKRKKDIYAMIGVREYFIFDPEYRKTCEWPIRRRPQRNNLEFRAVRTDCRIAGACGGAPVETEQRARGF